MDPLIPSKPHTHANPEGSTSKNQNRRRKQPKTTIWEAAMPENRVNDRDVRRKTH